MSDVTLLLNRMAAGEVAAEREVLALVYDELRARAGAYAARERVGHTLNPTALVHEAYLKLLNGPASYESRAHFFNTAAEAMRRVLVDHHRARKAQKRGGNREPRTLDGLELEADPSVDFDFERLSAALDKLKAFDERRYRVVMLRFFAGLTEHEVGRQLGVTGKTVQRDWNTARIFLLAEMRD